VACQQRTLRFNEKRDGPPRLARWNGQMLFATVAVHARDDLWHIASVGRWLASDRCNRPWPLDITPTCEPYPSEPAIHLRILSDPGLTWMGLRSSMSAM